MTDWLLDHRQRRALNRRIDFLSRVDRTQAVDAEIVVKIKGPGLWKMKVRGTVQLRPRLCFGPLESEAETVITFLQRADKKDNKPSPPRAESAARSLAKIDEIKARPRQHRAKIRRRG